MSRLISIIVPVYRSEQILPKLLEAVETVRKAENWNLELLLIDDGSSDNSYTQIVKLREQYPYIRAFRLARNFGHQAAVRFGLQACRGDYVAIIDDDLQDPPGLLPAFFKYLDEGWDVAYGVRKKRKEGPLKVLAYASFYRLLSVLSERPIPLDTGDFCVMKRRVVNAMLLLRERNPFLRGIRAWVGFKQTGVPYERQGRALGESGYTLRKLLQVAGDGLFSFSTIPLQFTTYVGVLALLLSVGYGVYALFQYFSHNIPIQGFTTLVIFILFFGSIQMICLGIIGVYIARIYAEGKDRPDVIVGEQTDQPEHLAAATTVESSSAGAPDVGADTKAAGNG